MNDNKELDLRTIGEALYIINKKAKECRDASRILKRRLFDDDLSAKPDNYPKVLKEMLAKVGIRDLKKDVCFGIFLDSYRVCKMYNNFYYLLL